MPLASVNESARSVVISANPNSGASDQRELVRQLAAQLEEAGFEVSVPQSLDELKARIVELETSGDLRTIVAAGGDGTASMLVNDMPFTCPLTMFPLGTENRS